MNLPKLSISRPIFMTCVTIALLVVGWASFKSMSVDLYPDVSIPVVTVQTVYAGAGPSEIETLVSRPIEEEISTISGIKRLTSKSLEGVSQVIIEFNSSVDVKEAEQQVRDKVNIAKAKLPDDVEDAVIKKFDPADTPIIMISLTADNMGDAALFDIADQFVKPRLEQVSNVGAIEIFGGREREIHVLLDRRKLKEREISVSQVAGQIGASGQNIPSGKVDQGGKELVFRGLGEFQTVPEISDTIVNLYGNEVPTRISDLGKVVDTLEDEKSRAFVNGEKSIFLQVFRQSGSNTVRVADDVIRQVERLAPELAKMDGAPKLAMISDASVKIRSNIFDVQETIIIGIILTVITVFFFLGSMRSTFITALSLPVSLIGAFAVMKLAGFSINIVSMLALTLAVGLLIDDAIVVIENIYRRMEDYGEDSLVAAERGTLEILMAVMAITLVVIAVFLPVGTMSGTIGQFLKQFGMTVVFSMAISWFVAMTLIPLLTAYFGGSGHSHSLDKGISNSLYDRTLGRMVRGFNLFQDGLERIYVRLLKVTLRHPLMTIAATGLVFFVSIYTVTKVPGAFMTDDDSGEFSVTLEMAPGTSLEGMNKVAFEVDSILRANQEVNFTALIVGSQYGESNKANFYVQMKPVKERNGYTTEAFRDKVRGQLTDFTQNANPVVKKYDASGGMGQQPFILNIISADPKELESSAMAVFERLKKDPRFVDLDTNYRSGKPEMQVVLNNDSARRYGVNTRTMGEELRAQVEGFTPAKFRERGREYEVRVRLMPEQRNLQESFNQVFIPNVNRKLVKLADVAEGVVTTGPASIERQDRGRYIQISAGLAPGVGLSDVLNDTVASLTTGETALNPSVRYEFGGDAENMQELVTSTVLALGFAILFIYLILSSLYESFITPITIMVALPLALSGAFVALFVMGETMTMFAVFGFFMLIGVAGKNGILLVDYTKQMMDAGTERAEALIEAGRVRLRPILMTSFALIAGVIPVAIGMNEASKTRTAMGVAIIGGMISSTILTLIVVPAVFTYVDRFRVWANNLGSRFTSHKKDHETPPTTKDASKAPVSENSEDVASLNPLGSK